MSKKKRRSKLRNGRKPMPPRKVMWIQQGYRCPLCGRQIRQRYLFTDKVNLDHIIPRSHGGTREPSNMQLTHTECNRAKGNNCPGCEECPKWQSGSEK